jgi:transposase InsO family protein
MAWRERSVMDERQEFVQLATLEGANRRQLCARFGVSPQTGYKWLRRQAEGRFEEKSRRPHHSPSRSSPAVEAAVLKVREVHETWGARKIAAVLAREGIDPPAASTVHAILSRHGCIHAREGGPQARLRFERAQPNDLWQMDHKGWFTLASGTRVHPLTIIDDHSRFALCLEACTDQTAQTVKTRLERVFRTHGLPQAFFVDNGNPWGNSRGDWCGSNWTKFGVWLLKLGIGLIHSRPYHPESRGKNERFHRSLNEEVLALRILRDEAHAQKVFNDWRAIYNHKRPHEGIGFATPASRYRPSSRSMPAKLPNVKYASHETVRRVPQTKAYIAFKGKLWNVPKAFQGECLAIRPLSIDGLYGAFFAANHVATIDLRTKESVNHVPEHLSAISPG